MELNEPIELQVVGVVKSGAKTAGELSLQGTNAEIEIFDDFAEALSDVDDHSHIWVLAWLDQSPRDRLKIVPKRVRTNTKEKGVFSVRSPIRPNPIGLTATRLLRREGNTLYLEHIDFVDGTPIIDIKPYSSGWDCIFSSKNNSGYETYSQMPLEEVYDDMLRQAANFHGDVCVGVAIGMRAAHLAMRHFECDLQEKSLKITAGVRGCIADAIQGLTQAGNKRFSRPEPLSDSLSFEKDGRCVEMTITPERFASVEDVLSATDEEIFIQVEMMQT